MLQQNLATAMAIAAVLEAQAGLQCQLRPHLYQAVDMHPVHTSLNATGRKRLGRACIIGSGDPSDSCMLAGIAIGGDVFPGSTLSDHCLRYQEIPQV